MDEILKTNGLTKRYRSVLAVDGADMTICRGDIYGFVGANGSGKTTVIRLVTGLASPTSGQYTLFGVDGSSPDIAKARSRISAIVEAPAIYTNMTAAENLETHCRILGIGTEKNAGLLEEVGLENVATTRRKAGNFSLGMRQRLGIALSLLGEPEFMILDEPLNGLDPQGIFDIREMIRRLNRERNITFLISSHILRELALIATRYGFISNGKLIQEITSDQLHRECRRSIDIEINDPERAAAFIAERLSVAEYTINDNVLRVFDEINVGLLVSELYSSGYNMNSVRSYDDNLEDYYLKVTGRTNNA